MKKPPTEELSRIRKLLANAHLYSASQVRIWRKAHTKLKRKVEEAFKRMHERDEAQHQLTLKLK